MVDMENSRLNCAASKIKEVVDDKTELFVAEMYGIIGGYILSHESIISIKFEEDLTRVEDMDIEHFIRSTYKVKGPKQSNPSDSQDSSATRF